MLIKELGVINTNPEWADLPLSPETWDEVTLTIELFKEEEILYTHGPMTINFHSAYSGLIGGVSLDADKIIITAVDAVCPHNMVIFNKGLDTEFYHEIPAGEPGETQKAEILFEVAPPAAGKTALVIAVMMLAAGGLVLAAGHKK